MTFFSVERNSITIKADIAFCQLLGFLTLMRPHFKHFDQNKDGEFIHFFLAAHEIIYLWKSYCVCVHQDYSTIRLTVYSKQFLIRRFHWNIFPNLAPTRLNRWRCVNPRRQRTKRAAMLGCDIVRCPWSRNPILAGMTVMMREALRSTVTSGNTSAKMVNIFMKNLKCAKIILRPVWQWRNRRGCKGARHLPGWPSNRTGLGRMEEGWKKGGKKATDPALARHEIHWSPQVSG